MPKRLKGRPPVGAAYVPLIAAGVWSLLALTVCIEGAGPWASAASLVLGALAGYICFRPSGEADESRGAWRVLGGGIVLQCVWLATEAYGPAWRHPGLGNSDLAGLLATVGLHSLTLCFYFLALAHSQRCRSAPTALLRVEMGWAALAYGCLVLLLIPSWRWRVEAPVWSWLPAVCAVLAASGGAVLALELLRRSLTPGPGRRTIRWLSAAALANAAQLGASTLGGARAWQSSISLDGFPAAVHLLAAASWAAAAAAASGSREMRREGVPPDPNRATGPASTAWRVACAALVAVPLLHSFPAETMQPNPSQQLHELLFAASLAALALLLARHIALVARIQNTRLRRIRQEAARSHFMLDSINDGIVTEDLAGNIQFANQQFCDLFGILPSDASHYRVEDFVHPEDRGRVQAQYAQAVEARRDRLRVEFRGVRSEGTTLWLEAQVTPIVSGGILLGRQSVLRDISRQRLIETSQRAMAQRLEFFVNKMPLGCIIWDLDFRVQEWNESAERIFGWSQSEVFRVRYVDFLVPEQERTALEAEWRKLRESKTSGQFQCQNLTKSRGKIDCEWHHTSLVDESGRVVAVASMVQDVTERKSLELQLVQSQKLEAVGTLAGGIAHDFNNLLTTILGHISLALMKLGPRHQAAPGLRDAETAAERAAALIQQLLRFSRKTPVELRAIDLNQCLKTVIGFLQHGIDRETDLEVSLAAELWAVEADRGQIEQVIMNLCVNARDAIAEGGKIRVHSANRFVDEAYCRTHAQGRVGEFVEFGVSDSGCGMDEATRARVFEPFFTTKEVGKGTGLGLAMVYGIVKDHRGWVEVQSDLGRGSAFRVFLPRTHRAIAGEVKAVLPPLHHGVETVLLAEDEEAVRKLGLEILERHGHPVLEARDGQEAVDLFRLHRDQIGLVVLDLTMPRRSGWEAFHEVRRLKPDVPVILSSGYSLEAGPQAARQFGAEAFLPKPYKAQQLLTLVQEVLDAEHSLKGGP